METSEHKQEILDRRYMRMATIWAENSYCTRRKVGALIVKDKMIISEETAYLFYLHLNARQPVSNLHIPVNHSKQH